MKESVVQSAFGRYLQSAQNIFTGKTIAFELKLINLQKKQKLVINSSNSKLNTVKDHQINGLLMAKKGLYHKISDSPIYANNKTRFTWQKPFDCVYISVQESYVGIAYYMPRRFNTLYLVPIDDFLELKNKYKQAKKVSMSYDEFIAYFEDNIQKIDLKKWIYDRKSSKKLENIKKNVYYN